MASLSRFAFFTLNFTFPFFTLHFLAFTFTKYQIQGDHSDCFWSTCSSFQFSRSPEEESRFALLMLNCIFQMNKVEEAVNFVHKKSKLFDEAVNFVHEKSKLFEEAVIVVHKKFIII